MKAETSETEWNDGEVCMVSQKSVYETMFYMRYFANHSRKLFFLKWCQEVLQYLRKLYSILIVILLFDDPDVFVNFIVLFNVLVLINTYLAWKI